MFQDFSQGADASTPCPDSWVDPQYETSRHLVLGSLPVVQSTIKQLHHLGYAEPNDWSRPLPTGRVNEVMIILTQRVRID